MAPPVIAPDVELQTTYDAVFTPLGQTRSVKPPVDPHPVTALALAVNPTVTNIEVVSPVMVTVAGIVEPAEP
jgi:hypothetical protein